MTYFLNGEYVDQSEAKISADDRGWLYGDAVFETVGCYNFVPFRWEQHWSRLIHACEVFGFNLKLDEPDLKEILVTLSRSNGLPCCIQRIQISRGSGGTGYSPKGADQCTVLVSPRAFPSQASIPPSPLRLVTYREWSLDPQSLPTQIKHSNRLVQVLGRRFADCSMADDSIMLSKEGFVAETTSANLFWFRENQLQTPPYSTGCLAGIGRELIFELWKSQGLTISEVLAPIESIQNCAGVFIVNAVRGIMPVGFIDDVPIASNLLITKLAELFELRRISECTPSGGH